MNHQLISEIIFEDMVRVSSDDTARAVLGRLTTEAGHSRHLAESVATCYLVAVAEAACIREMTRYIDGSTETVVGRRVDIDHRQPIAPNTLLRISGWVEQIGERSASFFVRAIDAREVAVCEARITLVAIDREALAARMTGCSPMAGHPDPLPHPRTPTVPTLQVVPVA